MVAASIIIPTLYREPRLFWQTVESVLAQDIDHRLFELIIVLNRASLDDQLLNEFTNRTSTVQAAMIQEPRDGLHYARHAGARNASSDILIYIDDDVILPPHWLAEYLDGFTRSEAAAAGGRVSPLWEIETPDWLSQVPQNYFSVLDYGDTPRMLDRKQGINGCNFAIRKEVLFRVGGFHPDGFRDEERFWHRGDGEYGLLLKLHALGLQTWYFPDCGLQHVIPADRLTLPRLEKLARGHSVSQAYTFCRDHRCKWYWVIPAGLAGASLAIFFRIHSKLSMKKAVKYHLRAIKYHTISAYMIKNLTDPALRKYVMQSDYLQ